MPFVEGAGVALHVAERGDGAALLIVHGMACDAMAWGPVCDELAAAGARAIVYDRRGYGASGAPEPYAATTVQEQAQDAGAVLAALDAAPALLVGEGFGALIVLELLVRRPQLARAAVLVDPPLYAFVPAATAALAVERVLLEDGLREGGPEAAIRAWLATGPRLDPSRAARAVAAPLGFFADYAGQSSWSPSRRELRAIAAPAIVLTGAATATHILAGADAVGALMPYAQRLTDGDVVSAARALL
jgi:pimeloyl-ACP methyl ester carboxylesterase